MKAMYNQITLAESQDSIKIESDFYFPAESVHMDFLQKHHRKGACDIQGDACYYDLNVDGEILEDAASSFSRQMEASSEMTSYIVFNNPVRVVD